MRAARLRCHNAKDGHRLDVSASSRPAGDDRADAATWRVRQKPIVWERPLRRFDLEALGADAPDGDSPRRAVADEGVKFALMPRSPRRLHDPHFDGYPMVLSAWRPSAPPN